MIHEPDGIIVIVRFPNGDCNFQAEMLPLGKELDTAVEMLENALAKMHEAQALQKLEANGGLIRSHDVLRV